MKTYEASAKTKEEAIDAGLEALGVSISDVTVEVIDEGSKGLFGLFGSRLAKVRLTVKETEDDPLADLLNDKPAPKPERKPAPAREERQPRPERKPDAPKPERKTEASKADAAEAPKPEKKPEAAENTAEPKPERKSKPRNRRERKDAPKTEAPETVAAPVVEEEPFVATPEDQLSPSAVKARDFIAQLTQHMGAPVTMEIMETPEQLRVKMAGENMSMLIGRRGETLDSVQYLTSLCVNRGREDYLRVSLDTENYRAKREEALRKLAVRMANRAKKTGKRVALEPMNPYERRILHSALQNDPEVTTHSEGEEPYRRVIITLK